MITSPSTSPKRFSVSAIRDFQRCSFYYKLARVDKVPEERTTHHRWAGSVVHAAFQLAYAQPLAGAVSSSGRVKTDWNVDNAGTIDDSLELFDMLWSGQRTEDDPLVGPNRAQRAYDVMVSDPQMQPPPLSHFAKGNTKALGKGQRLSGRELKEAWGEHFRKMLLGSLEQGLAYPVKEVEREVHYHLGGVPMIGYIDLVLEDPLGGEVYVDLKSGFGEGHYKLGELKETPSGTTLSQALVF